jgi:phosphoglycerate kinase
MFRDMKASDILTQKILDDSRIREHAKTVKELSDKKAKLVLTAHQGDPTIPDRFAQLGEHTKIL